MTKTDGWGNRYEKVEPQPKDVLRGFVRTIKNNDDRAYTDVEKDEFDRWEEVADSKVKQEGLF